MSVVCTNMMQQWFWWLFITTLWYEVWNKIGHRAKDKSVYIMLLMKNKEQHGNRQILQDRKMTTLGSSLTTWKIYHSLSLLKLQAIFLLSVWYLKLLYKENAADMQHRWNWGGDWRNNISEMTTVTTLVQIHQSLLGGISLLKAYLELSKIGIWIFKHW